jgi:hypothetical protein
MGRGGRRGWPKHVSKKKNSWDRILGLGNRDWTVETRQMGQDNRDRKVGTG